MSRSSEEIRIRRQARKRPVRRRWFMAFAGFAVALFAFVFSLRLVMGASASEAVQRAVEAIADDTPAAEAATPLVLGPGLPQDELEKRKVSFAAVGDMAFNEDGSLPSDGTVFFKPLKSALSMADVTIGNVEGTLATGGSSKCGANASRYCFAFRAPPKYAKA